MSTKSAKNTPPPAATAPPDTGAAAPPVSASPATPSPAPSLRTTQAEQTAATHTIAKRYAERIGSVTHLVYDAAAIDEAREIVERWESGQDVEGVRLRIGAVDQDGDQETAQLAMRCARVLLAEPRPATHAEYRARAEHECQGSFSQVGQLDAALQWALTAVLCGWSLAVDARRSQERLVIEGRRSTAPAA